MVAEKRYYTIFKENLGIPILNYYQKLNTQDWIDFFDDYYRKNLIYLLRIIDTPKGEDIYSYGLIYLKDLDTYTRSAICEANDFLLHSYLKGKLLNLLPELFNTSRFLKLEINTEILKDIIKDETIDREIRELAAITLSVVHENTLVPFWDSLDLDNNKFLIPSYISFFEKLNPIAGLSKLSLLDQEPEVIESFETPVLYSLHQISTSISDTDKFKDLRKNLPHWANNLIYELFEDYPELRYFKQKLQKPYEETIKQLNIDTGILDDLSVPIQLRSSFEILLRKLDQTPSFKRTILNDNLSLIDPTYIAEIDGTIKKLKNKLTAIGFGPFNDPTNEQVFEATENKVYYKIPTLFLYPYFLDENRIGDNEAGVIPYAKQTSIAIVLNKHNERYYEWEAIRDEIRSDLNESNKNKKYTDHELDRNVSKETAKNWLKSLIVFLYKQRNSEIHSVRGYVFHSIIQQFADKYIEDNKRMGEILRISTDSENFLKDDAKLPFYRKIKPSENLNHNQILLLDPADAFKISQNGKRTFNSLNEDEYNIIYVNHGLNIPVGIGFSLFAIPRLLQNNHWATLQNFMIDELSAKKDWLLSIGISMLEKKEETIKIKT